MKILSFDTSAHSVHVCTTEDGRTIFADEYKGLDDNRQSAASMLVPQIDQAIKASNWQKSDLDLIVVGIGPGSFTGIRVACVVARTIGQALNLPVLGISYLDCLASTEKGRVMVALSGNRSHAFVGLFNCADGQNIAPLVLQEPQYLSFADMAETAANADLVIIADELRNNLAEAHLAKLAQYCPKSDWKPQPAIKNIALIQAQIAWNQLSLKMPQMLPESHWSNLEPLYLRAPSITVKKSHADQNKTTNVS